MVRRMALAVCAIYFALLAGLAAVVGRAAPGPADQAIAGVGIGNYRDDAGIAYLSGRRLACTPDERDGLRGSRCRATVAGETLEIGAWRNPPGHPNQLGGRCEARYAGRTWPCRIGSRHVQVHWFAYLDEPLGLDPAGLAAIRREYPIENLGEGPFVAALLWLPPLTALVVGAGLLVGFRPWAGRSSTRAAAVILGALATLPITFFAVLFLTNGFWD